MSTELAPHRFHLNILPFLATPGFAAVGFALNGLAAAFYCIAVWGGFMVFATTVSLFRYMKHKSHISWPVVSTVGCMEDAVPR
jgi:hypothetical protein